MGAHAPAVHAVVPCALEQALPHAPQFDVGVERCLAAVGGVAVAVAEARVARAERRTRPTSTNAPALAKEHALPHAPQLPRLVLVLVSQPFVEVAVAVAEARRCTIGRARARRAGGRPVGVACRRCRTRRSWPSC